MITNAICGQCKREFTRVTHEGSAAAAYCSRACDKAAWYQNRKVGEGSDEFVAKRRQAARRQLLREAQ